MTKKLRKIVNECIENQVYCRVQLPIIANTEDNGYQGSQEVLYFDRDGLSWEFESWDSTGDGTVEGEQIHVENELMKRNISRKKFYLEIEKKHEDLIFKELNQRIKDVKKNRKELEAKIKDIKNKLKTASKEITKEEYERVENAQKMMVGVSGAFFQDFTPQSEYGRLKDELYNQKHILAATYTEYN